MNSLKTIIYKIQDTIVALIMSNPACKTESSHAACMASSLEYVLIIHLKMCSIYLMVLYSIILRNKNVVFNSLSCRL